MESNRIVIYAKDIEIITGRSPRYARKVMSNVRKGLGKQRHQLVSVTEFCAYIGLPEHEVLKQISR